MARPAREQIALETRFDDDDRAELAARDCGREAAFIVGIALEIEIARIDETMRVFARRGAAVMVDDGHRNVLDIERQAIAEQQRQQGRHHESQREEQAIAHDLAPFFRRDGEHAAAIDHAASRWPAALRARSLASSALTR